jgi:TonB family protein
MSKLKNLKRYRSTEPEAWEQRVDGKAPGAPEKVRHKHASKTPYQAWLVPGIVGLVFLALIGFVVKVFLSDSGSTKKAMYQVTLIKPPPPEDKVKPPEPEPQKETPKESIPTPVDVPQPQAQANDQPPDNNPPAGSDLGVEGDGAAGSDGFGLTAKGKGKGRDITLGGGGGGGGGGVNRLSMLTKYGWYTSKIQEEVKRQMRQRLDQNGGVPKGKLQIVVKIMLDARGTIVNYQIVASSGNDKMDEALKSSLPGFKISQPPPEGMPSTMTVRIVSQG